jgi:hypothetical protein
MCMVGLNHQLNNAYQERLRDWPVEAQQPTYM